MTKTLEQRFTETPDWTKDVMPSVKYTKEHLKHEKIDEVSIFDQLHSIKKLVEENHQDWSNTASLSELRWINIFKTLKQRNLPIEQFKKMVEFVFSIFESSTEVERVFSVFFDIWSPEKGQMTIQP